MADTKFTPGPWQAVEHYSDSVSVVDSRGFEIVEADDSPILLGYSEKFDIRHWGELPGRSYLELDAEEQAANARLIAAAPDLYAALELAVRYLPDTGGDGASFAHGEAVDALAKARGEA